MGEPWIKMRVALMQDPKVLSLALSLGTAQGLSGDSPRRLLRRVAVGLLLETWGLFHIEADPDGTLDGHSLADLDEHVGVPGWGAALVGVGWMVVTPSGVQAYEFLRWIGCKRLNQQRAREKKRSQRRKAKASPGLSPEGSPSVSPGTAQGHGRGPSSSSSSSSLSLPEGEPEREGPQVEPVVAALVERAIAKELEPVPPEVARALAVWAQHRQEIGKPLGATSLRTVIAGARKDPRAFVERVRTSLESGTTVMLEDRSRSARGGTAREQSDAAFHEAWDSILDGGPPHGAPAARKALPAMRDASAGPDATQSKRGRL